MQVFKACKQSPSLHFLRKADTNGSKDCLKPSDRPETSFIRFSVKVHNNDLRTELIMHPQVLEYSRVVGKVYSWLSDIFDLAPLARLVAFLLLDKVVLVIIFVKCCRAAI